MTMIVQEYQQSPPPLVTTSSWLFAWFSQWILLQNLNNISTKSICSQSNSIWHMQSVEFNFDPRLDNNKKRNKRIQLNFQLPPLVQNKLIECWGIFYISQESEWGFCTKKKYIGVKISFLQIYDTYKSKLKGNDTRNKIRKNQEQA